MLYDFTERKRTEEELIRQKVELARSNAELENFAYLIAHDLRAPLREVNGFSHILLEDYAGGLDEEERDLLRRVRDGALRMGQLIDNLLELSRLARMQMRRERVDLSALVRTITRDLERDRTGRAVEFVISESPPADGDARLLEVALRNLLDNARKFTAREPHPGWSSGPQRRMAFPSTTCATTASGLTLPTRTSYLVSSSGSTPPRIRGHRHGARHGAACRRAPRGRGVGRGDPERWRHRLLHALPREPAGGLDPALARALAKALVGVQRDRTHSFRPALQYFTLCQTPASS